MSRSKFMLEKSIAAMLSAIEIYNKPDFKYREEIFSILCINAWELLLKAKVLDLANNKLTALYVLEYRTLKSGKKSSRPEPRKNRSGNYILINLFKSFQVITQDYGVEINEAVRDNLIALTQIRDNSIHFVNKNLHLASKVQELGCASLQNYFHLTSNWFGNVLSGYNFYLMPLSFFKDFNQAQAIVMNASGQKVLEHIKNIEKKYDDKDEVNDFNVSLRMGLRFQKVKSNSGIHVQVTDDPLATKVTLQEEYIKDNYPWNYTILTDYLSRRYSNFKINKDYHKIRKSLEKYKRYAYQRLLDQDKPDGVKKTFYAPNIHQEFDKHYTKKQQTN